MAVVAYPAIKKVYAPSTVAVGLLDTIPSGIGGGRPGPAPEIVDQLDMTKTGGRARIVCDAEIFERMLARLKEADTALLSHDWLFLDRVREVVADAEADKDGHRPSG